MDLNSVFSDLGIKKTNPSSAVGSNWSDGVGPKINSISPVNGEEIGATQFTSKEEYNNIIPSCQEAFVFWRMLPAPKRVKLCDSLGRNYG